MAVLIVALLIVAILALAWHWARGGAGQNLGEAFYSGCGGSDYNNIGLYDHPYKNYPVYAGREDTLWDWDRRCAAYCQQPPCTIWCR